jgi:hypothetical protein
MSQTHLPPPQTKHPVKYHTPTHTCETSALRERRDKPGGAGRWRDHTEEVEADANDSTAIAAASIARGNPSPTRSPTLTRELMGQGRGQKTVIGGTSGGESGGIKRLGEVGLVGLARAKGRETVSALARVCLRGNGGAKAR